MFLPRWKEESAELLLREAERVAEEAERVAAERVADEEAERVADEEAPMKELLEIEIEAVNKSV